MTTTRSCLASPLAWSAQPTAGAIAERRSRRAILFTHANARTVPGSRARPLSADCIAVRAEATALHPHASGTASRCLSFAQVSGHPGLTNRCFKRFAACRAQRVGGAMAKGRCREHLKVTGRQSRTSRAICRMMPSTTALLSHASRSMIRTCAWQPRKSRRRASSDTPVWLGELLFPTQTTYTGCAAINKHVALTCLDQGLLRNPAGCQRRDHNAVCSSDCEANWYKFFNS